MQKTVCFDFDGVLHSYTSEWISAGVIPDPPVPGIRDVILELIRRGYGVVIHSVRGREEEGRAAMAEWLRSFDFPEIEIVTAKPYAVVYVDDRGMTFDGKTLDLVDRIEKFEPWGGVEVDNGGAS